MPRRDRIGNDANDLLTAVVSTDASKPSPDLALPEIITAPIDGSDVELFGGGATVTTAPTYDIRAASFGGVTGLLFNAHGPVGDDVGFAAFGSTVGAALPSSGAPDVAQSPVLTTSFAGPTEAQALNFIPPDPIMAAGPNNIVVMVNDAIAWYDKTGGLQVMESLDTFFHTGIGHDDYDPRVVYDPYSGHFYATADFTDDSSQLSRIYIAESNSSNLADGWKQPVFLNVLISSGGTNYWGDYPTLAVDQFGVYVTVNYFNFNDVQPSGGVAGGSTSRLYIVDKDLTHYSFPGYDPGSGLNGLTLQPAAAYGSEASVGLTGTFLVAYRQNSGNDTLYVIRTNNAGTSGATFSRKTINVGNISDLSISRNFAPEPGAVSGSTGIDVGDNRVYSAVWRDGMLYATTEINLNGRAVVHWFQVNTSTMTLVDQGNVTADDLGSGINTYYGAVTVNSIGQMAIGFSASGPSLDVGAYFAVRSPGDPAGWMEATQVLHLGQNTYFQDFGSGRNRWGDYSGASIDPVDDRSFWFFNEYASPVANHWLTQIGEATVTASRVAARSDFNGDGMSDLLWQHSSGSVAIWEMNGTTPIAMPVVANPGTDWKVVGTGDFNHDGNADLLWQNTNGSVAIWEMNGTTPIVMPVVASPGTEWRLVGSGNFSNDGFSDGLLWQNTNGAVAVWQMNGTTPTTMPVIGNPGPAWKVVGTGDFNADGTSDILLQNTGGSVAIWQMQGLVVAQDPVIGNVGTSWEAVSTGDFNSDGHADILFEHTSGAVAIWEMNGAASPTANPVIGNVGTSWQALGTGDYFGTGHSNTIVFQEGSGSVAFWEMNGANIIVNPVIANPGNAWHPILGS